MRSFGTNTQTHRESPCYFFSILAAILDLDEKNFYGVIFFWGGGIQRLARSFGTNIQTHRKTDRHTITLL